MQLLCLECETGCLEWITFDRLGEIDLNADMQCVNCKTVYHGMADYSKKYFNKPVFKTVGVKYATSTMIYTFMTDEECEVGDKAVVFTNGNWNVVTVMEVHDKPQLDGGHDYKWLVQIVDRTNYDRHVKEDGEGYPKVKSRL